MCSPRQLWWLCAVLAVAGACTRGVFGCDDDSGCVDGKRDGVCEPSGYCSFADLACPSGRRYGELADDGLAGTCVDGVATTSEGSSSSEASSGGGPGFDAYGPCEMAADCIDATAACVSNGASRMCAPSCTMQAEPSDECPPNVEGARAACLFTDAAMTVLRCFTTCTGDAECPAGMTCAAPVCTWPP